MSSIVFHLHPISTLNTRAKAGSTEASFSVEFAYFNAGRFRAQLFTLQDAADALQRKYATVL